MENYCRSCGGELELKDEKLRCKKCERFWKKFFRGNLLVWEFLGREESEEKRSLLHGF